MENIRFFIEFLVFFNLLKIFFSLNFLKINLYAKDENRPSTALVESLTVEAIPSIKVVGLGDTAYVGEKRRFKVKNVIDYNRLDVAVTNPNGMECVLDAGSERDGQTVTCCYTPRISGIVRI